MDHLLGAPLLAGPLLGRRRHGARGSVDRERPPPPPAELDMVLESPPLVFYGTPEHSTGALMSGRLRIVVPPPVVPVTVKRPSPGAAGSGAGAAASPQPAPAPAGSAPPPPLRMRDLRLRLVSYATTRKPVVKDCPDCRARVQQLESWDFWTEPKALRPGAHDFPFSYLLPGNLPATTMGSLGTVEYTLEASVNAADEGGLTRRITLSRPLRISRAVLPGADRTSVRIFPPTNLAGRAVLPSVVHPIGAFPVQLSLSGIVESGSPSSVAGGNMRWRLRRVQWRVEELQKLISSACPRHVHKLASPEQTARGGVFHQESRIVGSGDVREGWKTDFDTAGGEIALEFDACLRPEAGPLTDLAPLTDEEGKPFNPTALTVRHNLVVELIVAEEFVAHKNRQVAPTGAARVLRMLFALPVTERSGLGISWDEEAPPVYEDVPASPPHYPDDEEAVADSPTDASPPVPDGAPGSSNSASASTPASAAAAAPPPAAAATSSTPDYFGNPIRPPATAHIHVPVHAAHADHQYHHRPHRPSFQRHPDDAAYTAFEHLDSINSPGASRVATPAHSPVLRPLDANPVDGERARAKGKRTVSGVPDEMSASGGAAGSGSGVTSRRGSAAPSVPTSLSGSRSGSAVATPIGGPVRFTSEDLDVGPERL